MKKKNYLLWALALCAGLGLAACSDDDEVNVIKVIADDAPQAAVEAGGFWVVNEDWFGHSDGTVNYFKQLASDSYEAAYRAYRAANGEGDQLGTTTQFGAVWGDNIYLLSKQGNRLVVADAKTLAKKAVLTEIGGDGRAFVGIDDRKAYLSHSAGIAVFDLQSQSVGKQMEGASGQVGMMVLAGSRVFAVSASNGLYVINAATDEVEQTIEGSYYTATVSQDGNVWVAGSEGFRCINPLTLESTEMAYPEGGSMSSSWGAWNAGSLCASTQHNVLYWTAGGSMFGGGKTVFKYDIDTRSTSVFYALGNSDEGTPLEFYGAGLRVDPLTDNLILTVKHGGWGASGAYNWIYKLDNAGNEITHFLLQGDDGSGASWASGQGIEDWNEKYFWFPAMPLFEDANQPQILLNQVMLAPGAEVEVDLTEKVVDYDNTPASLQYLMVSAENELATVSLDGHVLKVVAGTLTGTAVCRIAVISNGVRVEKDIQMAVSE